MYVPLLVLLLLLVRSTMDRTLLYHTAQSLASDLWPGCVFSLFPTSTIIDMDPESPSAAAAKFSAARRLRVLLVLIRRFMPLLHW